MPAAPPAVPTSDRACRAAGRAARSAARSARPGVGGLDQPPQFGAHVLRERPGRVRAQDLTRPVLRVLQRVATAACNPGLVLLRRAAKRKAHAESVEKRIDAV